MEASEPIRQARVEAAVLILADDFNAATVTALRHRLRTTVTTAGLAEEDVYDFVLAVHELVTNAVRHGGGRGHLQLFRHDDVLVCEISDRGDPDANLPVQLSPADIPGGRGLWLAHHLTESLILTRGVDGVTATVTACLAPAEHSRHRDGAGPDGVTTKREDGQC